MMPDEPTTASAPTAERFISRRTLIAGAGAGATVMAFGGLAALTRGDSATAQDEATPSAEEVAEAPQSPASPEASPTVDLPAVPPEAAQFTTDWPMAQANYAATRVAAGTTIDSSNVSELGVAWTPADQRDRRLRWRLPRTRSCSATRFSSSTIWATCSR